MVDALAEVKGLSLPLDSADMELVAEINGMSRHFLLFFVFYLFLLLTLLQLDVAARLRRLGAKLPS